MKGISGNRVCRKANRVNLLAPEGLMSEGGVVGWQAPRVVTSNQARFDATGG